MGRLRCSIRGEKKFTICACNKVSSRLIWKYNHSSIAVYRTFLATIMVTGAPDWAARVSAWRTVTCDSPYSGKWLTLKSIDYPCLQYPTVYLQQLISGLENTGFRCRSSASDRLDVVMRMQLRAVDDVDCAWKVSCRLGVHRSLPYTF